MSTSKAASTKKPKKRTAAEIQAAKAAAAEKAAAAAEKARLEREAQTKADQAWLDQTTSGMDAGERDEMFRQISAKCPGSTKDGDRIVVACPIPKKLDYCVKADPFDCPNGKVASAAGAKLSDAVSKSLRDEETCIDGNFVSEAEGGSYFSPYVPWGPISGATKDGTPVLTKGNNSGVTIGTGVDLGAIADADAYLARLEKAGVSQATRDKLKPMLGKKRAAACHALRDAKGDGPMVLPAEDVEKIDLDAMQTRVPQLKKQYEAAKNKRIKSLKQQIKAEQKKKKPDETKVAKLQGQIDGTQDFADLTCSQQTVLFSTMYHEGSIGKASIKPFVNAVMSGDDDAARAALVAKTQDGNKLVAARGKRELAFFDEGR